MKKIYIFLPSVVLCTYLFLGMSQQVFAQQAATQPLKSNTSLSKGKSWPVAKPVNYPYHASIDDYWMNAALANDNALGGSPSTPIYSIGAFPVFPDSTVLFTFSNGNYNTSVQLCGNVLDPLSFTMQSYTGNYWDKLTSYSVDSMSIGFVYNRSTANNIIDTMVVYLYTDSNPANLPQNHFTNLGYSKNFGVTDTLHDTMFWKQMLYDYPKNKPKVANTPSMKTFKIPLTINDTGVVENKIFSTNQFFVPRGKLVVSAVGFIPGYTYAPGDLISGAYNEWRIIYFEMNGDNTYPTFFGTGGQKDWNLSEVITSSEFYNEAGNPWNGFFVPPYAFDQAYPMEEWDIYYRVKSYGFPPPPPPIGLNESISPGGIKLYQNQPNPSNKTTIIKYELPTSASVTLEVRDLMGRAVLSITDENQSAGKHSAVLNTSNLSKGMYLYTLTAGKESITRRMIVE